MTKLKHLVETGAVEAELLYEIVNELIPLVNGIVEESNDPEAKGVAWTNGCPSPPSATSSAQIMDTSQEIPSVDELTKLAGD